MKKIILSIFSFLLLFSIPAFATDFQYQENANGNWRVSGAWTDVNLIYDGDWDTYGYFSGDIYSYDSSFLSMNYTKPTGANSSSLIRYKSSSADGNFSIPTNCWNAFPDKVVITVDTYADGIGDVYNEMNCWTNQDGTTANMHGGNGGSIYDTAMWWNGDFPSGSLSGAFFAGTAVPIILLLIIIGLILFIWRQIQNEGLGYKEIIGIFITVLIALGFIGAIMGLV